MSGLYARIIYDMDQDALFIVAALAAIKAHEQIQVVAYGSDADGYALGAANAARDALRHIRPERIEQALKRAPKALSNLINS